VTGRLTVCIDARINPEVVGGVGSVVIALAAGLSALDPGDEEYVFLATRGRSAWLEDYLGGAARIEEVDVPPAPATTPLRLLARRVPGGEWWRRRRPPSAKQLAAEVPISDGAVERLGADVVHFPKQSAFLTDVPSIFHPHDLQHLHLPEFFTRRQIELRELAYRAYAAQAQLVAVASTWQREDVMRQYDLPAEKVQVIPWAPPTSEYPPADAEELAAVRRRLKLPDAFVLYPAQTWPHKNHLALLEALAMLRRDGLVVPLVSTGRLTEFAPVLQRRAADLGLDQDVRWLGFVSPHDLVALYRLARAAVIPTKFEASSFPLSEAFQLGCPAACSTVTSLPAQAGDSALLFDPDDHAEIADAVRRLWTDESLRELLAERGRANIARFTLDRTARHFRAHYRRLAGRELSEDDVALLSAPPLL